ncbi:MAG: sensor domain-containing diguanylate cyclase, partial [Chloroflexota bacterium]
RLMGVNIGNYAILRTVFETIDDPIFVVDENDRLVDASKAGLIFLGSERAGKGKQSFVALSKEWGECGEAVLRRVLAGAFIQDEEHAIQSGRDAGLQVSVTGRPIYDERGRASLALLVYRDITDRKRRERELAHLATHDSLTGLPNRRVLEEALKRAVARARRGKSSVLLFLDLDKFKAVNDTYGHLAGDKTLISLVRLLEAHLRAEDLVARVGGDEFAVLLRDVDADAGQLVVQRLNKAAEEHRLDLGGHSLSFSLSVGAVEIDGLLTPEAVLAQADAAMYAVKERKRGWGTPLSVNPSHPSASPPPTAANEAMP